MLSHVASHTPWLSPRRSHALSLALSIFKGHAAVAVFIVLSGFCLMLPIARRGPLERQDWPRFFTRRARRVLPAYYACLLLTLLATRFTALGDPTSTQWELTRPVTARQMLVHGLMLQDFHGPYKINFPLWSIAVEFHLYALFPLLYVAWRRWGTSVLAILPALGVAIVGLCGAPGWLPTAWHLLGLFAFGMAAACVCGDLRMRNVRERLWALPWFAWLPPVLAAAYLATLAPADFTFVDLGFGGLVALLLVRMSGSLGWSVRGLSSAPIAATGAFSYSLYLIHAPIIQLVYLYAVKPYTRDATWTTLLLLMIAVPIALASAYLFSRRFERPYLSSSAKAVGSQQAVAPILISADEETGDATTRAHTPKVGV